MLETKNPPNFPPGGRVIFTDQLPLALLQALLVQPRLPRHGEPRVGAGAEQREVGAALVETVEGLLQLHLGAVLVGLDHVVDLVQPLIQLLRDPGQGVAGVHPPPVVGLEGSDVEAGLREERIRILLSMYA